MPSVNDGPSDMPDSGFAATSLLAGSPTSRITCSAARGLSPGLFSKRVELCGPVVCLLDRSRTIGGIELCLLCSGLERPAALERITSAEAASLILILSDINMPGMSGLELLPKARAARPDVPIIVITAYGDAETKRKALEGGAETLLTKPVDFVLLRNEIETLVQRAA
jgi:CheY-like chemotaxis protein